MKFIFFQLPDSDLFTEGESAYFFPLDGIANRKFGTDFESLSDSEKQQVFRAMVIATIKDEDLVLKAVTGSSDPKLNSFSAVSQVLKAV